MWKPFASLSCIALLALSSEASKVLESKFGHQNQQNLDILGRNGYPAETYPFGQYPKRSLFPTTQWTLDLSASDSGVCSASNQNAANFPCTSDYDCNMWDALHTGYRVVNDQNPFHTVQSPYRYTCENNRCQAVVKNNEGNTCMTGLDPFVAQCNYPYTCSSDVCQRPLAAGCGPCTQDANSCMPGTVCDSVSNTCVARLQDGSQCIYKVEGLATESKSSLQAWNNRFLTCERSGIDFQVDPTIICNPKSNNCLRNTNFINDGANCDLNKPNGGCGLKSACKYNYTTEQGSFKCQPISGLGEECTPSVMCDRNLVCNGGQGSGVCITPFTVGLGESCGSIYGYGDVTGVCQLGLTCGGDGKCQSLANLGDSCVQSRDCSGTNLCIDGVCALSRSQQLGGACHPWDVKLLEGPCVDGLDCIDGECQNILGNNCSDSSQCGLSATFGPTTCLCDSSAGVPTCQLQSNGPSLSPLFINMNTCLNQVGLPYSDLWLARVTQDPSYDSILCCMLASMDQSTFGDPWISKDIVAAAFGDENKYLTCPNGQPKWVPRTQQDFCQLGANYALSGIKSLALISGEPSYSGVSVMQRVTELPPAEDPTSCGAKYCSGHGVCTVKGACSCNNGTWGSYCEFSQADRIDEMAFLQDLYTDTSGDYWVNYDHWLDPSVDYCEWYGITCDPNRFISILRLDNNNLRGKIPPSLAYLKNLQELYFGGNFLIGEIPENIYTEMNKLRVLDLSQNALTGGLSHALYHLESLERLILWGNHLSGQLPWSFGYLTNARVVLLNQNNFEGLLPHSTVNLLNVTTWDLTSNNFSADATLPSPICPGCERTFTKCDVPTCAPNECVNGKLMACTSPRAYQVSNSLSNPNLQSEFTGYVLVKDIPEQCVYRFG